MRLCASPNGRAGLFCWVMRRRGDGVRPECCAALTRRPQCGFHLMRLRIIICQQIVSRRGDECLPVLAPAQAWVRAGERQGNAELGRGDERGWRGGSVGGGCVRFTPAVCRADGGIAFGVRLSSLFYCGDLPSVHACCLPHGDKQDGLRWLAFLFRRVEIAIRAFSMCRRGYLPWWVHFGFGRFFVAISTGVSGMRGTGNGDGGAGFMRLCVGELALRRFPPGVRWGCAPQTAPKSLRLSGLSSWG